MEAIERNIFSLDWVTLVVLLSLILIASAKSLYSARFGDFTMLFATNKYMVLKGKEHKIEHPFNILLFLVNILSFSLFIYILLINFFQIENQGFILFSQIATAYAFLVLVKFFIEKIISNIFAIDETIDFYLFHKLSYRNFMSLALLPISLIFIYTWKPSQLVLLIITGLILLANVVVLIGFYSKIQSQIFSHWFYFIVYLCALEIAPYIILYKLFTR